MSFYGSIFYQATNAFAQILIKNSGSDKTNEATAVQEGKVELSADGRSSELTLDTGNRWIQIEADVDSNKCNFYHNRPDQSATDFMFLMNTEDMKVGETTKLDISKGVQFTVPLVYYDEAGHLVKKKDGDLYHTFEIPKVEIQTSVDILTERVEDMEKTSEELVSNMSTLTDRVDGFDSMLNSINSRLGQTELDTSELYKKMSDLEAELAETNSAAVANTGNIYRIETKVIAELEERIKVLEDKLNAQLG